MCRDHSERSLRLLDLFSGIGAFSLGFEKVTGGSSRIGEVFQLSCAVDYDEEACDSLRQHLVNTGRDPNSVICADLTIGEVHNDIVDRCGGEVDVIIGGPPCQSFSLIGPRSGYGKHDTRWDNDGRDSLYSHYMRLVSELEPKFVVFENVMGILSKRDEAGTPFIDLVCDNFRELGYRLDFGDRESDTGYIVLNAADYGVPQIRRRVFVIGNRLGLSNTHPRPTHTKDPAVSGLLPWVTLREAIGDLPELRAPRTRTGIPRSEHAALKDYNASIYSGEESCTYHADRFNTHYHSASSSGRRFLDYVRPSCPEDAELIGHVARGHQVTDQELFERIPEGNSSAHLLNSDDPENIETLGLIKYGMGSFKDKYKKQAWNRPSSTVFAHMRKDGNRFIHPDSKQARSFTVREAARIQSIPDDYPLEARGLKRFVYIGNAVPPLLSKAIAESLVCTAMRAKERGI